MDNGIIFRFCKNLGCCDACCFRYLGLKKHNIYKNVEDHAKKYKEESCKQDSTQDSDKGNIESMNKSNTEIDTKPVNSSRDLNVNENNQIEGTVTDSIKNTDNLKLNSTVNIDENRTTEDIKAELSNIQLVDAPPCKRKKVNVCVSCVGVLQKEYWQESFDMIKEVLEKKGYDCQTYSCGISAPISTILREKIILLKIVEEFSSYDPTSYMQLKDAWKFSFREQLANHINKTLDIDSPLMITVNMDYADDLQELEVLKEVSPELFKSRSKQRRRFPTEFTRTSVEKALESVTLEALVSRGVTLHCATHAICVSVVCVRGPHYLAGRYIKLSRNLPQSPWVLEGRRVLPTSVQEIMFQPIADIYKFSVDEAESRLKLIAAGREDVDVRCLGEGRPFAIEITDPSRHLTVEELQSACERISRSGDVILHSLAYITKEDLVQLKKGEETKSKSYVALCTKLTHSGYTEDASSPVVVTQQDCDAMNSYRNTEEADPVRVNIAQKTPVRVLHRRPALTRTRHILDITAQTVPKYPQLFLLNLRTSAGTYVKEWVHGDLGRTRPSLSDIISADTDLLALDVTEVHLEWPPKSSTT